MAVVAESGSVTPAELRRRLADAGYDIAELLAISEDLKVDIIGILAAWTPTLTELFSARRRPWWKRLLERLAQ